MLLKEEIQETIRRRVVDPELGINVVDLGLIYDIRVAEEKITVEMTLTSPGCPYGEKLLKDVKSTVEKNSDRPVEIRLVWEPTWSRERMSQVARDHLMFFGSF